LDVVLDLNATGLQEIIQKIISSANIDLGVLGLLGQLSDEGVMLVGTGTEVEFQFLKIILEIDKELFNSLDELIDWASSKGVEFSHIHKSASPFA
jgi:hypothetical protein